jgi:hypothetical protein
MSWTALLVRFRDSLSKENAKRKNRRSVTLIRTSVTQGCRWVLLFTSLRPNLVLQFSVRRPSSSISHRTHNLTTSSSGQRKERRVSVAEIRSSKRQFNESRSHVRRWAKLIQKPSVYPKSRWNQTSNPRTRSRLEDRRTLRTRKDNETDLTKLILVKDERNDSKIRQRLWRLSTKQI